MDHPDYDKLHNPEACDELLVTAHDDLEKLVREQADVENRKREANAQFSADLKAIAKRMDHQLGVIDALRDRRKIVVRQGDLFAQTTKAKVEEPQPEPPAAEEKPAIEVTEKRPPRALPAPMEDGVIEEPQDEPLEDGSAPEDDAGEPAADAK